MEDVTIRELRNRGGEIIDRVERGEHLRVTRDGRPVASLHPLPRRALDAKTLVERWRHLPPIDGAEFRADVDALIDQSL